VNHAVYLATSYANRASARTIAVDLRLAGRHVTSAWHDWPDEDEASLTDARRAEIYRLNLDAIRRSDALVLLRAPSTRGGCFVEAGYALGRGLPVLAVGDPRDATCMLWGAEWLPDVATLARRLDDETLHDPTSSVAVAQ
jgi:nucleoside 2-deoxyribosyltransferase